MNGGMILWENATTHVSAHALHYGTGVFEGVRCYETPSGPAVFRLDAHLDRLYASAESCGMPIPFNACELAEAICEVVRRNDFRDCYIRPLCYYGSNSLGLNPRACPVEVAILAWPWETYLGTEGLEKGVSITVSPWRKFHSSMMPTKAKACGQYINSVLALRDALDRGYAEALLLDAEEAFFTGTAAEVTPIREVDGTKIGGGARGPVTHRIQQAFFAAVSGRDPSYREWLHPVLPQLDETNGSALVFNEAGLIPIQ